jgi:hypothetical protein
MYLFHDEFHDYLIVISGGLPTVGDLLNLVKHELCFLYPHSPKGEGGILFYLCPSFRLSKIFFVALFSVTVDGRNLMFGHKHHIGIPYCG